jgi:RNA polymerase sigma factor (TIGR02999 family)
MVIDPSHDVTTLLLAWNNGDQEALDRLMPVVYNELRRMARRHMQSENPGHTLQATALVNDLYMQLIDQKRVNWKNRAHFFGVSAQIIRRLLVDHARARHRLKRGGGALKVEWNEEISPSPPIETTLLALDDALNQLSEIDPEKTRIIELRFFAGLSINEIAEVLKISPATVKRDWAFARAWLYRQLTSQ